MPEDESIEELNELPPGFKSRFERVGMNLYQDGIRVEVSQLTPDELKEHFPDLYEQRYSGSYRSCPVPECHDQVLISRISWVTHIRLRHPDFFTSHKRLKEIGSYDELKALVAAETEANTNATAK